jgi:hypothetical protein
MRFVVLFEDHPDAGADVRRNHMSDHLAFLERNSHKVNAAGPLKNAWRTRCWRHLDCRCN